MRMRKQIAPMNPSDTPAANRPPTPEDELTIYEAAMFYAGRRPYPEDFGLKDGRNSKREHMLTYLKVGLSETPRKSPRAQRSWDIFCQLIERIEGGRIKPIRPAYDLAGKVDPYRTVIQIADLVELAKERGERPKNLKRWLGRASRETPIREATISGKTTKREAAATFIREKYPDGLAGVTYREIARELQRSRGLRVDPRTIRRALGHK
jgi:hypothetical protein